MAGELLIPESDRNFVQRHVEWDGRYDVLISVVGKSREPIRRAILSIRPRKVFFLTTAETTREAADIIKEVGLGPGDYSIVELKTDSKEIYDEIKIIISKHEGDRIAIDITGGKKAMSAMASVAGAFYGLEIIYTNYTEYDPITRKPAPGSEFLESLPNPLHTSGDLLMGRAIELFNNYNFNAVIPLLEEVKQVARDPRLADIILLLSKGFKDWAAFLFDKAHKQINMALKKSEQYQMYPVDADVLKGYLEFLEPAREIRSADGTEDYFGYISKRETAWPMIASIYNSGRRYEEIGRHSEAILRYYRVVEMVSQHQLGLRGINTGNIDFSKEEIKSARNDFTRIKVEIMGEGNGILKNKIGLLDGYILLLALGDSLVKMDEIKNIKDVINPRNHLYLIHAWHLGNEKQAKKLRKEARELMSRIGINDQYIQQGRFAKLEL